MERYRDAFYEPFLSDWQNHENWQLAGSRDTTARVTEIWQRVLREVELPSLDPARCEAMEAFMAKRKETLGSNEPVLEPTPL